MKRYRLEILLFICLFVLVLVTSIGYSAFNTSLSISGDAVLRRDADIRIDKIELVSLSNGGTETYNSKFSRSLTSMFVSLPNTNSSVVYRVTISNKTGKYFTPLSINESINSNKNVKYTISGLEVDSVYQGSSYSFNITFTTTSSNQSINLTLKYNFQALSDQVWDFPSEGRERIFKSDYNATYKLEVWGAQGGYAYQSKYHGGYGAYSKGEVVLNKNSQIFINVGGSGGNALALLEVVPGGYNGGGANTASNENHNFIAGGGGGATHIAKVSGLLSSIGYNNRDNILIVAGGGGGASYNYNCPETSWKSAFYGGSGGGYIGLASHLENTEPNSTSNGGGYYGSGGSQTSPGVAGNYGINGSFGLGGSGTSYDYGAQTSGGGGGFYGGSSSWGTGSGGGSGYIGNSLLMNKEMYCYGCPNSSDVNAKTFGVKSTSLSATAMVAKEGSGYARITILPKN